MSINIGPPETDDLRPKIAVIGVGGAGGNAVANMINAGVEGVDFIVANTDAQALKNAAATTRVQLGPEITGGLGAGARPEVGKAAAEETVQEIEDLLEGVNMCFIAAGMGGGTGTGAAPIIAEAARRMGVLTVGVVTKPFLFEGARRMRAAEAGIEELQKNVDTLLVIPNQNLFLIAKAETTFKEAFLLADEVLQQGVRAITDLMVMPGLINLDFADVKSVMEEMGKAMMGTGESEGPNRALEAAEAAIANPLLDGVSMQGAKGVIISIIGGEDMKLLEVDEAANHIRELVDDDANIIWGSAFNPALEGRIRVSVVATGIEGASSDRPAMRGAQSTSTQRPQARQSFNESASVSTSKFAADPSELDSGSSRSGGAVFGGADDDDEGSALILGGNDEVEAAPAASGDVDRIVDPLEGIRGEVAGLGEPKRSESSAEAIIPVTEAAVEVAEPVVEEPDLDEPLDLGGDFAEVVEEEVAAAPASPPAEAEAEAKPRRFAPPSETSTGTTLFERMANLSRGSDDAKEEEEEQESAGSGASLNIPRFLGRQNNQ